ncbi:hypothetical protein CK203_044191 [Vitis vinifera]|uniref:Uncharacterized protein n=1 Tax=Vitis vinifera TaxID=29760 RepID=A0A438I2N7_VITVI|nr:hypothetical protein CK203_044191 [Vitis vinifera]
MKQHFPRVKGDIGPCKSIPPNVKFRMENSLQEFVNSKKATQEAYEYRNPYGPNVSQFERDMVESEEEVQEMQCPMTAKCISWEKAIWRADMVVGRFFYDACTSTNVVNSFYFKPMLDAISAIGPGYIVKNAANLFLLFDEVIEWIGCFVKLVEKKKTDGGRFSDLVQLALLLHSLHSRVFMIINMTCKLC